MLREKQPKNCHFCAKNTCVCSVDSSKRYCALPTRLGNFLWTVERFFRSLGHFYMVKSKLFYKVGVVEQFCLLQAKGILRAEGYRFNKTTSGTRSTFSELARRIRMKWSGRDRAVSVTLGTKNVRKAAHKFGGFCLC